MLTECTYFVKNLNDLIDILGLWQTNVRKQVNTENKTKSVDSHIKHHAKLLTWGSTQCIFLTKYKIQIQIILFYIELKPIKH